MSAGSGDAAVRAQALEQLTWHWDHQLWPGLAGLTDDEYLWEPVPGCWSVRPRDEATAPILGGTGSHVVEFAYPEPVPAPVTTIAWRLAHVIVGVLGVRRASHFGGPPVDYFSHEYATTAAAALEQLSQNYEGWVAGVRTMPVEQLWAPVGEAEGSFSSHPYLALILHINREVIHHGAEVLLLRDLFRHR
jgi:hypothetical protein